MSSQVKAKHADLRQVKRLVSGIPATDGAGVELVRVVGQPDLMELDPFLLLDAFRSDNPDDYIAGFPSHPHRGFETVTYLLNGRMRHKDNAGNEGVIGPGGVQWMTAARGIVHSEMPEQENGLLEGFQLWVNLPASHKMSSPAYQEFDSAHIPTEQRPGTTIRVISGNTSTGTRGAVNQPLTDPVYFDVTLDPHTNYIETLPATHSAFVYLIEGSIEIESDQNQLISISRDQLGIFDFGTRVDMTSQTHGARFLIIAGLPLGEPIVRSGPFVMNSEAELRQAYSDFRNGLF